MYNDVITLVSSTKEVDEYGDIVNTPTTKDVFCEVKSIGMNEFYQAQTVGMKPELKCVIADYFDYENQQEVIYEGYKYKVLRTYRTTNNALEITCYGGVRNVSA